MDQTETAPILSLVIACYNESKVFDTSIKEILDVLTRSVYPFEIIFVDDCSADDTRQRILNLARDDKRIKYIFHEKNTGRGRSVTDGLIVARGAVAGFIDFDLATAAWYIPVLAARIIDGADLALATRVYKISTPILHRWLLSRGYHYLMMAMLGVSLGDTETGCKFFNRAKILPVLGEIVDPHWFWDTEICVRSFFHNLRISSVPTLYLRRPETGSTVRIIRDSWAYFLNLLWFRKEVKRLKEQAESRAATLQDQHK